MKKDKSHGQDKDCRPKLVLINGDDVPAIREANRKPSTPGEGHHAEPRVLPDVQGCTGQGVSVPGPCWGMKLWLWPGSFRDPTGFL